MTEGAAGIVACGVYVPRLRLSRAAAVAANGWMNPGLAAQAAGHRAMANWDEDAVTLAVEAGRRVLQGGPTPDELVFASTSFPFADRSNAGLVAAALDLPETVRVADAGGSQRAATAALAAACFAAEAGRSTLLIGSDRRVARPGGTRELVLGDGAAAVLVGREKPIARLIGTRAVARDMVDHYRAAASRFDYVLEERWIREAGYLKLVLPVLHDLLKETGVAGGEIRHFILPAFLAKVPEAVAKAAGIPAEAVRDPLARELGDTGVGHALLMLAHALEIAQPGDRLLVAGFGQGVDALLFEATEEILRRASAGAGRVAAALAGGVEETAYTKFLSFNGLLEMDWGIRAERDNRSAQSVYNRKLDAVTRFVGGRCTACGTVQFPKARICVNPDCHAIDAQSDHRFADTPGRLKTFTEDWQASTPAPPLPYGNVQFEGGGNVFMELTDCAVGGLAIGMPVAPVFRIKDFDDRRGFRRYFWKAAPLDPAPDREAARDG